MRKATRFAIAGAWLAAAGIELPHHFLPSFTLPERPVIGVVGDSLTTGLGQTEEGTWPRQLREGFRLDVRSAAQPGAKCASALKQADVLGDAPNVVVVEIGGNDLFGAMWNPDGVADYEQRYDALLTKLARPGRRLLGVELPLPPWCPHWGAAQRRVAGKHGVALIPKWRLLAILCSRGATADGIHPTRAGQDRLTALFAQALGLPKPRQ